jgi:transcription elongation factor Elf1
VTSVTKAKSTVRSLASSVSDVQAQSDFPIDLTEPIDIYSEWIDAADAAEQEAKVNRPIPTISRRAPRPAAESLSDGE